MKQLILCASCATGYCLNISEESCLKWPAHFLQKGVLLSVGRAEIEAYLVRRPEGESPLDWTSIIAGVQANTMNVRRNGTIRSAFA
jgi:hypothetical protein